MKRLFLSFILICLLTPLAFSEGINKGKVNVNGMTELPHAFIHSGNLYQIAVSTDAMADGTTAYIMIDLTTSTFTTDYDEIHIAFNTQMIGDYYVTLIDSPTITSSHTLITPFNYNRDTSNTHHARFYGGVNTITAYNAIHTERIIGGSNPARSVLANARTSIEYVLEGGRHYIYAVRNDSGGAADVSIFAEFYEVLD